ncbi:twin-arginine translocase subunit TatC [Legionella dresdenensis]|uniref:Sec-independent protein translocase protein TatC n=1 Tax=Legionella dresdenensis TaxID=450200 RepID=A0ABV8CE70_9GAMM
MLGHLLELRQRAIKILCTFGVLFLLCFYYADSLFTILVSPLMHALPVGEQLIATQVTSPVFTPLALATNIALFATAPVFLWQVWRFVIPGLYRRERRLMQGIILTSLGLFCLGVLFCFWVILPFMFRFFLQAVPAGVKMLPDMANATDFITRMLLLFGLCFQVPLIVQTLVQFRLVTVDQLIKIRPYIIVAAFTVAMLLTPPDVMSQIMLAIPLCLLYEFGILLARGRHFFVKKIQ